LALRPITLDDFVLEVTSARVHNVNGLTSVDFVKNGLGVIVSDGDGFDLLLVQDFAVGIEEFGIDTILDFFEHLGVGRSDENVLAEVHRSLEFALREFFSSVSVTLDDCMTKKNDVIRQCENGNSELGERLTRSDDRESPVEVIFINISKDGFALIADLFVGAHYDQQESNMQSNGHEYHES
jgi:hypothetical protein